MVIVSYIRENEAFFDYACENELSGNEQLLWRALFHVFNKKSQGNIFPDDYISITNKRLLSLLPMQKDAMAKARDALKERGLIEYVPGERNADAPKYKLVYFCPTAIPSNENEEETPPSPVPEAEESAANEEGAAAQEQGKGPIEAFYSVKPTKAQDKEPLKTPTNMPTKTQNIKDKDLDLDLDSNPGEENKNDTPVSFTGRMPEKQKKSFEPPTVEAVATFCREQGFKVNAEVFVNHYAAQRWMIGKNRIDDWRAKVREWEANASSRAQTMRQGPRILAEQNYTQREYAHSYDTIDRMYEEWRTQQASEGVACAE